MAEKKSWRDYLEDEPGNESTSSKKTGGWRDYNTFDVASTVGNNIVNRVNTYLDHHNTYITDYQNRYSSRKGNYEDAYVSDSAKWMETVQSRNNSFNVEASSILSYMDQYKGYLDADWMKQVREAITSTRDVHKSIYDVADKDNQYWSSFGTEELLKAHGSAEEAYKYGQRIDGYSKKYEGKTSTELQDLIDSMEDGEEKDWLKYYEAIVGRNELLSVGNNASKNYDPDFNKYVAQGKEYLYMTDQERNIRIAEYDDMYFNAKTEEERREAEALSNALREQELYIKRTAPNIEGLDEEERKVFLYHLGKDLEEGTMDYSNAFFEDLTGRKNNAIQSNSPQAHFFQNSELFDDGYQFGDVFLTAAGSIADLGVNAVKGAVRNVEGMVDFLGYGVAGVADLVGADGFADSTRDAMRWSATDAALGGVSDYVDQASIFGSTIDSVGEGIGQVFSLGKAVGLAQKAFNLGKVGTNVVSSLLTYSSSAGLGITEAYENNATDGEAYAYGAIAGLAETVSELLWGGIGKSANMFGLSGSTVGLDELVSKNVSKVFSGTFGRNLAQYAVSGAFEGVEEVLAGLGQAVAKKMTYLSEEDLGKIIADENLLEQFIVGTITGYLVQTPDLISKTKAGRDLITGLTDSETFLLDTEFDAYVQESKAEGYDLNNKQQDELYEKAQNIIYKLGEVRAKEAKQATKDAKKAARKSGIPTSSVKPVSAKALTKAEVRGLLAANNQLITAEDTKKIQKAAEARLTELGQAKDVQKLAELATKYATGQKLSKADKAFLANNKNGNRVAQELIPENIMSGEYTSEWAEGIGTKQVNKLAYNIKNIIEQMANPAVYKPLSDRISEDEKVSVSDNGKATISGTDEEISIDKKVEVVDFVKDKKTGKITDIIINANGKQVKASEIDFADEDQAYLFAAVKHIENITPADAQVIIRDYDPSSGISVGEYLNGIDEAYTYGYHGYSEADMKSGLFTTKLSDEKAKGAYELGKLARKSSVEADETARKRMRTADEVTEEKKVAKQKARFESDAEVYYMDGKNVVKFDEHTGEYDDKRTFGINAAKILSRMGIGGKYYFYESYVKDGVRVYKDINGNEVEAPNGLYQDSDGSIYIDLNAGDAGQGTVGYTLAHELLHFVKAKSKKQFKILADLVAEAYSKTDMSMHKRVLAKQKFLSEKRGKPVSYNEAHEEVVADAMSTMITDGSFFEKLVEIKAKDKGLFNTIKQFFKNLIAKFQKAYESLTPELKDARDIREVKDMFDKIQTAFAEALVEASDNFQAEQNSAEAVSEAEAVQQKNSDRNYKWKPTLDSTEWGIVNYTVDHNQGTAITSTCNMFFKKSKGKALFGIYGTDDSTLLYVSRGQTAEKEHIFVGLLREEYNNGNVTDTRAEGLRAWAKTVRMQRATNTDHGAGNVAPGRFEGNTELHGRPSGLYTSAALRNVLENIFKKETAGRAGDGNVSESDQAKPEVKKYSERDSNGNKLSKEQLEYFKDSMVRDENGNLKVVYHGTRTANFTVFKRNATYFTDNKEMADSYSPNGDMYEGYVNITKPYYINAQGEKWSRIPIDDSTKKFLQEYGSSVFKEGGKWRTSPADIVSAIEEAVENGDMDYDGIIIRNVDDTGSYYKDKSSHLATDYIVFNSNQFKNADNKTPTSDPDIRYSPRGESQSDDIHSRIFDLQSEEGRLNRSIEEFEHSEDFKSVQDKMYKADNVEDGVKQYLKWREESGYGELIAKRDSVREELKKLREERDNIHADESVEKEKQAIAKSGLSEADYFRKQAVKEFGYTPYFYDAGYITPNGKMLNFSGEKGKHFGSRGQDHRAIGIIYENTQGSAAMVRFMNEGNIRIMAETPGLDISSLVEPTKEQYALIRKFARENGGKEHFFAVDISDENGRVIGNYSYEDRVNADRVVNDIKYFFENGKVREQSSVAQFHWSERGNAPTFYSQMGKVVEGMKQDKFGASSVISMLRGRGVKAEEIRWSGIQAFLDGKKSVTKAELLNFINSSMLHVEEEARSQNSARDEFVQAWMRLVNYYVDERDIINWLNDLEMMEGYLDSLVWDENLNRSDADYLLDVARKVGNTDLPAKWEDYKLDGGTNYRELVFKMPGSNYTNMAMQAHWGNDAQGVLAHARMQDFEVHGKKMLFIEEIQSDWHNEGAREGYATKTAESIQLEQQRLFDKVQDNTLSYEERQQAYQELRAFERDNHLRRTGKEVPDAPFKDNYHEYVLKRLLRMAAEEGYDSIGWTTAEIQSQRWSDDYAEGYRIEYDQDIPKFLKKYGKQWGAEVSKENIDTRGITEWEQDMVTKGIIELVPHLTEIWSMDITPAMKKSVLTDGQAMYSERGDGVSNRDLLANAFETLSQNSEEYKLIQQYKGRIKLLNEYEEKLSKLNAEIREITFGTEGERDYKRLRELQAKAKEMAGHINRHDRELLKMEASEPLRKVIEQERRKEAQKTKAHIQEIQQNKKLRAEQTEYRHKIRRVIRDLNKILKNGNKKQNVKEDMKGFVSKALELADYLFQDHVSNDDLIRKGITVPMRGNESQLVKETEEILNKLYDEADSLADEEFTRLDAKRKRNLEKLRGLLTEQRNQRLQTPVYNLFNDLITEYASLKNSSQESVKAAYDPYVENFLRSYIGEADGETDSDRKTLLQNMRVADMTTDELWKLYNAYTMVLKSVRDANKLHVKGRTESIDQMVTQIVTDFEKRNIPDKKLAIVARNISNKIGWDYEKLYYALDRIGSNAFTELIMNLANSENIVMRDVIEAAEFRDQIVEKYGFNNWDVNKEIDKEFLDNTGKKFKLTLGQLMSLYAYSRRDGAWDHIEYGGFAFGKAALTNPKPADSYKLSKEQCVAITNTLTKEQKAYVEDMQKFLSETMGAKGNEVSMELYGIKMFNEKNYFPIHIAGDFKPQAKESQAKAEQGFQSMSNAGFTHAQNPNAKAPFVLEDFNDIWADHVNEMSRYHGTVPALEDIRRVMNRSSYSETTTDSTSVKVIMKNHFGEEAVAYFDNLYREANSGAIRDKLEEKTRKRLSLFRKNSVAYKASVLVQQPTSIIRAYSMIGKKYFGFHGLGTITSGVVKTVADKLKWTNAQTNAYNEMLKYAPGVTMAKDIGGFDTATGGSIRSYLLDTGKSFKQKMKTENLKGKGKAVMDLVDDNAIANLPNVADKIAWIEIWNACKRETAANHKDLATSSDEFMQIVGERFTEVIRATQVYDSIFSKSPMLKSKHGVVQYLVSFMSEPNTVANMAESAVRDAIRGDWKSGAKKAVVIVYAALVADLVKSIIYAMDDDDEDETYAEKYIEALVGSLVNDFNPLSYIPFVRDISSALQGYDIERPDMAIIVDAIEALQTRHNYANKDTENMTEAQIAELEKNLDTATWNVVYSVASLLRIPVKNIRKDVLGIYNTVFNKAEMDTTMLSLTHTFEEALNDSKYFFLRDESKSKSDKLYEAIINGDTAYRDRIKDTYKTDDSYHNAVRKALRENDPRIKEAALAEINGNPSERVRIARLIIADGFVQDDVVMAINSEINALKSDDSSDSGTAKKKGFYTTENLVREFVNGDTTSAKTAKSDIISTAIANGKTKEQAEKNFMSNVSSSAKKAYEDGWLTESKAKKLLVEYAGEDEEGAASKVNYWTLSKLYPKYKDLLNESRTENYYEYVKPAGISMDTYAKFLTKTNGLANKYDKYGNLVQKKQDQVIDVIDSLPITRRQKNALFLAAGYAESGLKDVPW